MSSTCWAAGQRLGLVPAGHRDPPPPVEPGVELGQPAGQLVLDLQHPVGLPGQRHRRVQVVVVGVVPDLAAHLAHLALQLAGRPPPGAARRSGPTTPPGTAAGRSAASTGRRPPGCAAPPSARRSAPRRCASRSAGCGPGRPPGRSARRAPGAGSTPSVNAARSSVSQRVPAGRRAALRGAGRPSAHDRCISQAMSSVGGRDGVQPAARRPGASRCRDLGLQRGQLGLRRGFGATRPEHRRGRLHPAVAACCGRTPRCRGRPPCPTSTGPSGGAAHPPGSRPSRARPPRPATGPARCCRTPRPTGAPGRAGWSPACAASGPAARRAGRRSGGSAPRAGRRCGSSTPAPPSRYQAITWLPVRVRCPSMERSAMFGLYFGGRPIRRPAPGLDGAFGRPGRAVGSAGRHCRATGALSASHAAAFAAAGGRACAAWVPGGSGRRSARAR